MDYGVTGKTPVFSLLKRDGKVFVTIVPKCSKRVFNAHNSREDPRRIDNSYRWLDAYDITIARMNLPGEKPCKWYCIFLEFCKKKTIKI